MKVKVKLIGISAQNPGLECYEDMHIDFPGHTLGELSHYLMSEMDSEVKEIYLTELGEFKNYNYIVLVVNGIGIWNEHRNNLRLNEGDIIELIEPSG